MQIEWYNNTDAKNKLNKSPDLIGSGVCNIFGTCNMDTPNFIVDQVRGNYVKFDNRYYFVDSRSYVNGKWVIHCTVDDLYTNRDSLLILNVNVIRNEYKKNPDIADSYMPLKANRITDAHPINNAREIISNDETTYIIGVI